MTDGRTTAARDTLRRRYPEAAGSPPQVALALIQLVARAVGAAPGSSTWQRATPADGTADPPVDHLLAALTLLRWLGAELDSWQPHLIAAARERGATWADLAPALGVTSRQAAERRYLRMRVPEQPPPAGSTREARVDAERDRRAGHRALSQWARENGANLRQLAGQITALTNLDADARGSLDRLHHGLGQADPTALVQLLTDTHRHLAGHPALAERVDYVTHHADQVRRTAQQQRRQRRQPPRQSTGTPVPQVAGPNAGLHKDDDRR